MTSFRPIAISLAMLCAGVFMQWTGSPLAAAEQDTPVPLDAIHDSANEVMQQNDFRSVRRRMLERIPTQDLDEGFLTGLMESISTGISEFFSWLLPPSRPRRPQPVTPPPPPAPKSGPSFWDNFDFARAVAIVVVLIVAGIVIWVVARIVKRHQQDPERGGIPSIGEAPLNVTVPPGEIAASTYESRARQYAEQKNFAAAIRELLLGSMSWIERAGLIRFRKGLTNRDYVRAVWRQEDRRAAYLVTGTEFELVFFGRRMATSEMFRRCLTAFQGAFSEEAATARDEG